MDILLDTSPATSGIRNQMFSHILLTAKGFLLCMCTLCGWRTLCLP